MSCATSDKLKASEPSQMWCPRCRIRMRREFPAAGGVTKTLERDGSGRYLCRWCHRPVGPWHGER